MTEIIIQTDERLIAALRLLADQEAATVEEIALNALTAYVEARQAAGVKPYSFIGIGSSSKRDCSRGVDEILERGANRREGWSLE
jgi:hypothetical protein